MSDLQRHVTRARHSVHTVTSVPTQITDGTPQASQRRIGFLLQVETGDGVDLYLMPADSPNLELGTGIMVRTGGYGYFDLPYSGPITVVLPEADGSGSEATSVTVRLHEYFG